MAWRLGQSPSQVDELVAAWALEAEDRGPQRLEPAYWDQARPWLQEHVR